MGSRALIVICRDEDTARELSDIPAARHLQNVIDLFGEAAEPPPSINAAAPAPSRPAPPQIADLVPRIEARIVGQGGEVERWYTWAEKQYGKKREVWGVDEYARLLATIERTEPKARQSPQEVQEGTTTVSEGVRQGTPAQPATDDPGASEPGWRETLQHLATDLLDQLNGNIDPKLAERIQSACAKALQGLERLDLPQTQGEAWIESLRTLQDELTGQLRLGEEGSAARGES